MELANREGLLTLWVCQYCGHEVFSQFSINAHNMGKPAPIQWTDGHTCIFVVGPEDKQMHPTPEG